MARGASPFYYSGNQALGAQLGQSLGTALFGDPEAAAKQAMQRAQMDNYAASAAEANAHAGLYGKQGEGVEIQNNASRSIPDLIRSLVAPPVTPAPVVHPSGPVTPGDEPVGETATPAPTTANVDLTPPQFRTGLPAVIAALGQMQGDKVDPNKLVGLAAAMFGNDELARRGMVGEGQTPGKEFALTPERADDIARQGYNANYLTDTAVAKINHASDIPVANIQAGATERGQDVRAKVDMRGQDLEHGDRLYGINVKAGADIQNPAGGNVLARALGPNATITSNARTPDEQRQVYAQQHPGKAPVMDSAHLDAADGYPGFDVRPLPGMTFEQAKQKVAAQAAAQGGYLHFAQDEGTHWHFDIRGVKGSSASASATGGKVKPVSAASNKMLSDLIDARAKAEGLGLKPGAKQNMLASAAKLYQGTGNPDDAVGQVFTALHRNIAARNGGGDAPPVAGARKAPDGNWYVRQGNGYARVDVGH